MLFDEWGGWGNERKKCIHQAACMLHRKKKPYWCEYSSCSEFIDEHQLTGCHTAGEVEEMLSAMMDDIFDRGASRREVWSKLEEYNEETGGTFYDGITVGDVLNWQENYHSAGEDDYYGYD